MIDLLCDLLARRRRVGCSVSERQERREGATRGCGDFDHDDSPPLDRDTSGVLVDGDEARTAAGSMRGN
jgi:hypothetical protein